MSNTVSFAGGTLQFANTPGGQFVGANMLGTSIKNSTAAVAINANGQTVVSAPIDGTNTGGLNLSGGGMLVLTGASVPRRHHGQQRHIEPEPREHVARIHDCQRQF